MLLLFLFVAKLPFGKGKTFYSWINTYISSKNRDSICRTCLFAVVDILKRHKINSMREMFFPFCGQHWNGDEATRYTCTFSIDPWIFILLDHITVAIFPSSFFLLFFVCCLLIVVFYGLYCIESSLPSPFWHKTLSTTNHRCDKKMRDEISSIMPKLYQDEYKNTESALSSAIGQSLHVLVHLSTFTLQCHLWFVQFPWKFVCSALHWFWIDFSNLLFNLFINI